jgi:hypothetical protein
LAQTCVPSSPVGTGAIKVADPNHQQMMSMQLTWDCDGVGDGAGDVERVAGDEDCAAADEAPAGGVDCVAGAEDCAPVPDETATADVVSCSGKADVAEGSDVLDGPVDGEVAEAPEPDAVVPAPLPVDVCADMPEPEVAPGFCGADAGTAAAAPTGASPPPAVGRLPRTRRPITTTPATPPVTVALSPRPRRFRERLPRLPR